MASRQLIAAFLLFGLLAATANGQLSESFYAAKCPQGPAKALDGVKFWVQKDRFLAPSLLRLHFHDCFVRVFTPISIVISSSHSTMKTRP
ncbi:hypothetical protein Mapa_012533 [Marchantia paleacea]|nr:hypothetical protein Mapa_012533 [Marchantia paleacea]